MEILLDIVKTGDTVNTYKNAIEFEFKSSRGVHRNCFSSKFHRIWSYKPFRFYCIFMFSNLLLFFGPIDTLILRVKPANC